MRIKKIHVSKQQITLLQQLQQRVKVSKSGLKCTVWTSNLKCTRLWEGATPSHTYPHLALRANKWRLRRHLGPSYFTLGPFYCKC